MNKNKFYITNILCLVLTFTAVSMEEHPEDTYKEIYETDNNTHEIFKQALEKGDEDKALKYLVDHQPSDLYPLLCLTLRYEQQQKKEWQQLIAHFTNKGIRTPALIKAAFDENNIPRLKEFTNFNKHWDEKKKGLNNWAFQDYLNDLGCNISPEDIKIKICLYDRINFKINESDRYVLSLLIRDLTSKEKSVKILNLIDQLNPEELDVQDARGNTALHEAILEYNEAVNQGNTERFLMFKNIIDKLIEKGANCEIANNQGERPIDSSFFQGKELRDDSRENTSEVPQRVRTQRPKQSTLAFLKRAPVKKIITLGALSLVGAIAGFYVFRTLMKQPNNKATLTLK